MLKSLAHVEALSFSFIRRIDENNNDNKRYDDDDVRNKTTAIMRVVLRRNKFSTLAQVDNELLFFSSHNNIKEKVETHRMQRYVIGSRCHNDDGVREWLVFFFLFFLSPSAL